jgi:hypothetical protein
MKQLIEDLISAMEYHVEQTRPIHSTTVALQAAREALRAQPAPVQPVAWRYTDARGHYRYRGYRPGFDVEYSLLKPQALYTTPPAAPVQEPVAQGSKEHLKLLMEEIAWEGRLELSDALANIDEFYTTPPAAQRPFVGLTDRDAGEVIDYVHTNSRYGHHHTGFWMDFYRAIEAKLRSKNNG